MGHSVRTSDEPNDPADDGRRGPSSTTAKGAVGALVMCPMTSPVTAPIMPAPMAPTGESFLA